MSAEIPDFDDALNRTLTSARLPGAAEIRRRGDRRTRVRAISAVAATCAVLAAIGLTATVSTGRDPRRLGGSSGNEYRYMQGAEFANRDHGYLLLAYCTAGTAQARVRASASGPADEHSGERCRYRLVATADAGRTWRDRTLPSGDLGDAGYAPMLMLSVLGPDTLVVSSRLARDYSYVSQDGGRTWRGALRSSTRITVLPEGGIPQLRMGELEVLTSEGVVGSLDNGDRADVELLDTSPELAKGGVVTASDGSLWVPCASVERDRAASEGSGQRAPCVLVTRDRGATWQTLRPVPVPSYPAVTASISTYDGRTVVVSVSGVDSIDRSLTRAYRSTDGGATWRVLPPPEYAPTDGFQKGIGVGSPAVLSNGDLLVPVDGALFRLPAGAGEYQRVSGIAGEVGNLWRAGPWLVAMTMQRRGTATAPVSIYLSADGTKWTKVRLP